MNSRVGVLVTAAVGLVFSCSDSASQAGTVVAPATQFPSDIAMNKGAGHGGYLTVTLRLETGLEFPCTVDTGSPGSLLPKSAESALGKRVGTRTIRTLDGPKETVHIYAAPKLFLGATPLVTAVTIGTWDDESGVLGMDCLCHYCVQLDFQSGRIRFLDPEKADTADLGKSFPLISTRYAYIRHAPLFGHNTALLLDTGDPIDGVVSAGAFKRAAAELHPQPVPILKDGVPAGTVPNMACFATSVWDGISYTNLAIESGRPNLLGLRFLARHTVTFNFPKRVVYLKVTSANPLPLPPP
jgi:hypothetical protein